MPDRRDLDEREPPGTEKIAGAVLPEEPLGDEETPARGLPDTERPHVVNPRAPGGDRLPNSE